MGIEVNYVDHMGNDLSVVNSARVSFGKQTVFEEALSGRILSGKDVKLIRYLATHKHYSPFGHCFASFHVKAPVFVRAQLVKHEYLRVNEISRRYVDTEPEFYVPDVWRSRPEGDIKQGSGTSKLPTPDFEYGFCRSCGGATNPATRTQGGGRATMYCSDKCKYAFSNQNRNPYKAAWDNAKSRAKREGKEWSIEFETFDFPSHCPILKIEIDYKRGKKKIQDNSPSFDRLDPSKEYIKGNVRLISNKANTMKSNASSEELVTFAKSVLLQHAGLVIDEGLSYKGLLGRGKLLYNALISAGYSPEQARMVLPQSMMTEWYWSGSLDAFANMCNLRLPEDSQYESRLVAQQISAKMLELYPVSWEALVN